jgi:integrase/recombinase XerD
MFSYYCNGLNFRDLAKLKFKNIDGDMLRFIREKTKKTSQGNQQVISCFLTKDAKEIIKKWGNEDTSPDNYIFPILDIDDSPLDQSLKIDQLIQTTNKNMKRICEFLKLGKVVTTYFSRHSAATVLKRSGASIVQISEALGHSNTIVTQKYLDSLDDDSKKELAKALTKFE